MSSFADASIDESDSTEEQSNIGSNISSNNEDLGDYPTPIFDGSGISTTTFLYMFVGMAEKHNLSKETQSDILHFCNTILPQSANIPGSSTAISKSIQHLQYSKTEHLNCKACLQELQLGTPCQNEDCQNNGQITEPFRYTIMDLLPQLQRIIFGT